MVVHSWVLMMKLLGLDMLSVCVFGVNSAVWAINSQAMTMMKNDREQYFFQIYSFSDLDSYISMFTFYDKHNF